MSSACERLDLGRAVLERPAGSRCCRPAGDDHAVSTRTAPDRGPVVRRPANGAATRASPSGCRSRRRTRRRRRARPARAGRSARRRAGRRPAPARPSASKMYRHGVAAAEHEPLLGPVAGVAARSLEQRDQRPCPVLELLHARRLERVGDGRVEGRAQDHQHDQRGDAAPRHEAPADPPDQLRLVGEGRLLRVVVAGIEPARRQPSPSR